MGTNGPFTVFYFLVYIMENMLQLSELRIWSNLCQLGDYPF